MICRDGTLMGLYLRLLTDGASLDVVADPLFHSGPPIVLLDLL